MVKTTSLAKKFLIFLFSFWVAINAYGQTLNKMAEWQVQIENDPKDMLAHFNLGVSYHKDKQFERAIYHYKRVIKSKSGLRPIALYYISKIYKERGNIKKAKKAISYINLYKLPEKFRDRISNYKSELLVIPDQTIQAEENQLIKTKNEDENRLSGSATLSFGYNSNPQFISADDTTNTEESDGQMNFGLNLNYLAIIGETYDWGISYGGSGRAYNESSDSNFQTHAVNLPLNLYTKKYRFQIQPSFTFQTFSGRAFASLTSGSFEVKRKFDVGYLSLGLLYDSINNLNDDYFYLDGQMIGPYVQWQHVWLKSFLYITYGYFDNQYQDSDTVSPSYKSQNVQVSYTHNLKRWAWTLSVGNEMRTYSFDVTENDTRKDNRIWGSTSLAYSVSQSTQVFVNLSFNNNDSNFDQNNSEDKNYQQLSSNLGLNWRF